MRVIMSVRMLEGEYHTIEKGKETKLKLIRNFLRTDPQSDFAMNFFLSLT